MVSAEGLVSGRAHHVLAIPLPWKTLVEIRRDHDDHQEMAIRGPAQLMCQKQEDWTHLALQLKHLVIIMLKGLVESPLNHV